MRPGKLKTLMAALGASASLALSAGTPTGLHITTGGSQYMSVDNPSSSGYGWSYHDNVLHLAGGAGPWYIYGADTTGKVGIKVERNGQIFAVSLKLSIDRDDARGALELIDGCNCTLTFAGDCSLKSGRTYAGIEVPPSAALTIRNQDGAGSSTLIACGGEYGAGIGGANNTRHPGSITIDCDENGTVKAYGNYGAGIGGGMKLTKGEYAPGTTTKWDTYRGGDCNNPIIINGGNVYARGNMGSAGIGGGGGTTGAGFDHMGGSCSDIRINGGNVNAIAQGCGPYWSWVETGAGIGAGAGAKRAGGVQITGGTVYAQGGDKRDSDEMDYALGGADETKTTDPVVITGGSVRTHSAAVGLAKSLQDDSGAALYEVTFSHLTPQAAVTDATLYSIDPSSHIKSPYDYGLNDLYADGDGKLHFLLPNGRYQFEAGGLVYKADVASAPVEAETFVTVTLDANGGTFVGGATTKTESMSYGDKLSVETPTRPGYSFGGWYDLATGRLVTTSRRFYANTALRASWYEASASAKVVVANGGKTLRFVYDNLNYGTKGTDWFSVAEAVAQDPLVNPPWYGLRNGVTKVIFDTTFADYHPSHCGSWFWDFKYVTAFEGLANLKTAVATSLTYMFGQCESVTSLDLSGFDTRAVIDMQSMFYKCKKLKTIYVSADYFKTGLVTTSGNMFLDCTALVGGNGTTYDGTKIDKTYARIDKSGTPGYFTGIPQAVLENGGKTLRFVCDGKDHGTEGTDWFPVSEAERIDPLTEDVPWSGCGESVTKVVFDKTFAGYRPSQCGSWFYDFGNLARVEGIENLDTSEVKSMAYMFGNCGALKALDLSTFDTANVTDMTGLFLGCESLHTICASERFVTVQTVASDRMFLYTYALVGGKGTTYNAYDVTKTYARLDGGADSTTPGYFSIAPQAVVEDGGETLRFVCDGADHGVKGTDWFSVVEAEVIDPRNEDVPWYSACATKVTKVIIDETFAEHKPISCGRWFFFFINLAEIEGLENLDTSEATSLCRMFTGCLNLQTLDLSAFDTANVTDTFQMFTSCLSLETIHASQAFDTGNVTDSANMFADCSSLVGGKGTTYSSSHKDKTYARVDGGTAAPGYFTPVGQVLIEDEGATLRFVCDGADHGVKGTDWFSIPEAESKMPTVSPPWYEAGHATVEKVVFDESFTNCAPKHCGSWFENFKLLEEIEGIENLDVSQALYLSWMFADCSSLETLDLSGFNTASMIDMAKMFLRCHELKTIYVSTAFVTSGVLFPMDPIFEDCTNLVGGCGTAYDANYVALAYARIDGGPESATPGYFTALVPFNAWAEKQGLTGADAEWDAKPAKWGGQWANGFIYKYGEGLADGTLQIMRIGFDADAKPVITTTPVIKGHNDFTPAVIGSQAVKDWSAPVVLENTGDDWTLPTGKAANFFKVKLAQ